MSHGLRDICVCRHRLLCAFAIIALSCACVHAQAIVASGIPSHSSSSTQQPSSLVSQLDTTDVVQYNGIGREVLAQTPTSAVKVSWTSQLAAPGVALSEPLFINGYVVVTTGSTLKVVDASSKEGSVIASLELDSTIDYHARPLFVNNTYYIAVQSGRIQAVDLSDMHQPQKLWFSSDDFAPDAQAVTSLRLINLNGNKLISFGTVRYDNGQVTGGEMAALNIETGSTVWKAFSGSPVGYYLSDAPQFGKYFLRGDTSGTISACEPHTGQATGDIITVGSPINSDFTALSATEAVYTTFDGKLHKLTIGQDGVLTDVSIPLFSQSVSSPVISGNLAVVTGMGPSHTTQLSVVDLDTMQVQKTITHTSEGPLSKGGSKAPALLVKQGNDVYAYFSASEGGTIYVYKLGDDVASLLYTPSSINANQSHSPLIADQNGSLYYLNDSGYLVKLSIPDPTPSTPNSNNDVVPTPAPLPDKHPSPLPQRPGFVPNMSIDNSTKQHNIRVTPNALGIFASLSEPQVSVKDPKTSQTDEDKQNVADGSMQDKSAESDFSETENEGNQILFVPVEDIPMVSIIGLGAAGAVALALTAWFMLVKP
ncbi:PQQ-binding-like beta-propeller repeat protein [Atopobium fossor]|uniref:PQQ-binding-like beta-propeller repeat protein n=1 Tax=Atopobium fossor TaxID=39487 RepID=UPI00040FDB14|nr:PQQ-binding-like beta-propeller repeat protein [Atopobium fossor]